MSALGGITLASLWWMRPEGTPCSRQPTALVDRECWHADTASGSARQASLAMLRTAENPESLWTLVKTQSISTTRISRKRAPRWPCRWRWRVRSSARWTCRVPKQKHMTTKTWPCCASWPARLPSPSRTPGSLSNPRRHWMRSSRFTGSTLSRSGLGLQPANSSLRTSTGAAARRPSGSPGRVSWTRLSSGVNQSCTMSHPSQRPSASPMARECPVRMAMAANMRQPWQLLSSTGIR